MVIWRSGCVGKVLEVGFGVVCGYMVVRDFVECLVRYE